MIIDESDKAGIRERARALFRVTETILVIALLILLLWMINLRFGANFMALEPLRDASVAFDQAASYWNMEQAQAMGQYPPPSDSAGLAEWTRSIAKRMGYPAGLLIERGSTLYPVGEATPELREIERTLSASGRLILKPPSELPPPTGMANGGPSWQWQGKLDGNVVQVYLYDHSEGTAEWAMVCRLRDYLPVFASKALSWKPNSNAVRVSTIVAVDNKSLPGMRVSLKDSLLGSTPGLDTTHIRYAVTSGEIREEYYLPLAQQLLADRVRKPWFPWLLFSVDVLLMAVVYGFHRWIKELTTTQ